MQALHFTLREIHRWTFEVNVMVDDSDDNTIEKSDGKRESKAVCRF